MTSYFVDVLGNCTNFSFSLVSLFFKKRYYLLLSSLRLLIYTNLCKSSIVCTSNICRKIITNLSKLRVICNIISSNCNLSTFSRYNFLFVFLRFSILLFNKLIILFICTAPHKLLRIYVNFVRRILLAIAI